MRVTFLSAEADEVRLSVGGEMCGAAVVMDRRMRRTWLVVVAVMKVTDHASLVSYH